MTYENSGYDQDYPKPVDVWQEYDVEIKETSRRGDGVARIEGLVVFIPNAKPGDKLRIKVTNVSRRFAEAEVIATTTTEETTETE